MTQPWHRRLRHWIGSKSATKPEAARPAANVLYAYKNFAIELPADHLLPVYQRKHVKYDRFLPHLCKYVEPGSMVIDVGANCGDTLAAMCDANPALQFLCIEPDDSFFTLLEENILRIKAFDQSISIYANKSLVGKTVASASLEGSGGTKHAVLQAQKDSIKSESLDVIMEGLPGVNVRLLKSDVDGFDYDVIDSAEGVIQADQPILFFECHCDHEYQKAGYKRTLAKMHSTGYENWVVFDNFGQAVLQTTSIDQLDHLIEYVWKQNTGEATRTIYYYDFLAFTSKDADLIAKVMAEY